MVNSAVNVAVTSIVFTDLSTHVRWGLSTSMAKLHLRFGNVWQFVLGTLCSLFRFLPLQCCSYRPHVRCSTATMKYSLHFLTFLKGLMESIEHVWIRLMTRSLQIIKDLFLETAFDNHGKTAQTKWYLVAYWANKSFFQWTGIYFSAINAHHYYLLLLKLDYDHHILRSIWVLPSLFSVSGLCKLGGCLLVIGIGW